MLLRCGEGHTVSKGYSEGEEAVEKSEEGCRNKSKQQKNTVGALLEPFTKKEYFWLGKGGMIKR